MRDSNKVIFHHYTCKKILDMGISDNALMIYFSLKSMYNVNNPEMFLFYESIYYFIYGKTFPHNRSEVLRNIRIINEALDELESNNLIKVKYFNPDKDKKEPMLIDLSGFFEPKNIKYGEITRKNTFSYFDIQSIRNIVSKYKGKILRYLFILLYLRFENNDMYYFSKDRIYLCKLAKTTRNTIDKYNNFLYENKIIYIYKYEYKYVDSGKTLENTYGLYEDKDAIKSICDNYISDCLKDGIIKYCPINRKSSEENKTEDVSITINEEISEFQEYINSLPEEKWITGILTKEEEAELKDNYGVGAVVDVLTARYPNGKRVQITEEEWLQPFVDEAKKIVPPPDDEFIESLEDEYSNEVDEHKEKEHVNPFLEQIKIFNSYAC